MQNVGFEVDKTVLEFEKDILNTKKNILQISNNGAVQGILRASNNEYLYDEEQNLHYDSWRERLENHFAVMMEQNPSYFQIRFIGIKNKGKEIVRVDKINEDITIVKSKDLQSKQNSGYFKETIKIKEKSIYISEINLNREHNTIVFPYLPTLRVATPVYEKNKKIFGMVVININVNILFNFENLDRQINIENYIANKDGYYLYHKDIDKTFGFEFGKKIFLQNSFNIKNFMSTKQDLYRYYDYDLSSAIAIKKVSLSKNKFIYVLRKADSKFFDAKSQDYFITLGIYIIFIAILIAILTLVLTRYLTLPIIKLATMANTISKSKNDKYVDVKIKSGDEIEELSNAFQYMLDSLYESKQEIEEFAEKLEEDVDVKTKELQVLNDGLETKVTNAVNENRKKDELLAHQSKLAAMGEMMGNIAHQWRQPLNAISGNIQFLKDDYEDGLINEEFIDNYTKENMEFINFMSKTIDDFRDFFVSDKVKREFSIHTCIEKPLNILRPQLNEKSISLNISGEDFILNGLQSELQQVILNIVNNARDILVEKNTANPIIKVTTKIENDTGIISIQDNAGGIPSDILNRIFEPYFTTKEQGKGTGIGLYMSKMIIVDNMKGELIVSNNEYGAVFDIKLKI